MFRRFLQWLGVADPAASPQETAARAPNGVESPGNDARAETPYAPVIGISGSKPDSKSVAAMMSSVEAMGGRPVFLGNHGARNSFNDIAGLDGLIVMGNDYDIDPATYRADTVHPSTKNERDDPAAQARAAYETAMIQEALKRKMPLLGVCGGMQRINVLCGGTLNQHIPDLLNGDESHDQSKQDIPPFTPVKYVAIDKNSLLGAAGNNVKGWFLPDYDNLPYKVVKENSFHHQSVAAVGHGLRASAAYEDGITAAIEADPNGPYRDQFLLGVQFHPEFGASALAPKITGALVSAARNQALAKGSMKIDSPEDHTLTETTAQQFAATSFVQQLMQPPQAVHSRAM